MDDAQLSGKLGDCFRCDDGRHDAHTGHRFIRLSFTFTSQNVLSARTAEPARPRVPLGRLIYTPPSRDHTSPLPQPRSPLTGGWRKPCLDL